MPLTAEQISAGEELQRRGKLSPEQLGAFQELKKRAGSVPSAEIQQFKKTKEQVGLEQQKFADEESLVRRNRKAFIERKLGAKIDVSKGVEDFGLNVDLARSDNAFEWAAKLRKSLPEAQVEIVDILGDKEVYFRMPEDENFRPINAQGIDLGDVGSLIGNLATPETFLATATASTPLSGAILTPLRWSLTGLASVSGEKIEQEIERQRGFEFSTIEERQEQQAAAGAAGVGGEAIGGFLARVVKAAKGGGIFTSGQEAQEFLRNASDIGLGNVSVAQASGIPIIEIMQQKAGRVAGGRAERFAREQREEFLALVKKTIKDTSEIEALPDDKLFDFQVKTEATLIGQMAKLARAKNKDEVERSMGGKALVNARKVFDRTASERNARAYAEAAKADTGHVYDVTDNLGRLDEIGKRIQVLVKKKELIESDVLDVSGKKITKEIDEQAVKFVPQAGAEVRQLIAQIKGLVSEDGAIHGGPNNTATDAIRALIRKANELAYPPSETFGTRFGKQNQLALELRDYLLSVLDNPKADNAEFLRKIKIANNRAKFRFKVLDNSRLVELAKREDTPTELFESWIKPDNADAIRIMHRVAKPAQWEKFQDAFFTKLSREPGKIIDVLDSFAKEPRILRMFMSEADEISVRNLGHSIRALRSNPINKALQVQNIAGQQGLNFVKNSAPEHIDNLIKVAGGEDSQLISTIQRGIIQNLYNNSKEVTEAGTRVVNPNKFVSAVEDLLDNSNVRKIFTKQQLDLLEKQQFVASFIRRTGGPGVSIEAAQLAGEASGALGKGFRGDISGAGLGVASTFTHVLADKAIGWLLTHPRVAKGLFGTGKQVSRQTALRAFAIIAMQMQENYSRDAKQIEEDIADLQISDKMINSQVER